MNAGRQKISSRWYGTYSAGRRGVSMAGGREAEENGGSQDRYGVVMHPSVPSTKRAERQRNPEILQSPRHLSSICRSC